MTFFLHELYSSVAALKEIFNNYYEFVFFVLGPEAQQCILKREHLMRTG